MAGDKNAAPWRLVDVQINRCFYGTPTAVNSPTPKNSFFQLFEP